MNEETKVKVLDEQFQSIADTITERYTKVIKGMLPVEGATCLHPVQSLNVIGENKPGEEEETVDDNTLDVFHQDEQLICANCEIPDILGDCKHCGIYQYVIMKGRYEIQVKELRGDNSNGTYSE